MSAILIKGLKEMSPENILFIILKEIYAIYEQLLSALGQSLQTLLCFFSHCYCLTISIKLQCVSHTVCTMHVRNILHFAANG